MNTALRSIALTVLPLLACVAPDPQNLGEGEAPAAIDEPCEPNAAEPCVEDTRCDYVIDGDVQWFCTPHGSSIRPGDPCEFHEDCGPGMQCTDPAEQRYCRSPDEDIPNLDQPCDADGDCARDDICRLPPDPELTCVPRCIDDMDCDPEQTCETYAVVHEGQTVPDVFSACADPN